MREIYPNTGEVAIAEMARKKAETEGKAGLN